MRFSGLGQTDPTGRPLLYQGLYSNMARILVVEDEPTIAAVVAEWLGEVGHRVIGPAADVEIALRELANKGADMALLDVNLGGVPVGLQLAEMLKAQRIPVAFITGYAASLFPVGLREHPRLEKPFGRSELLSVVAELLRDAPFRQNL